MITQVTINDNRNTPIYYLPDVFDNGTTFEFKGGVNIIVGENGSGKSTLLRLIENYLLIDKDDQDAKYLRNLYDLTNDEIKDGADVKSDYMLKTFRFCHIDEMTREDNRAVANMGNFQMLLESSKASTGESITIAINSLWKRVFGTDLASPMTTMKYMSDIRSKRYIDYIMRNAIPYDENYEVTILLDEPDRNLDIFNIKYIYNILAERKEHTQLIAVIHNPLLIHKLSRVDGVNLIEMTRGYVRKIDREIKNYL